MNTDHPLVSVIMPVYNASAYLAESVESILGQTYDNLELIVIDDGSEDASLDILRGYALNDKRIVLLTKQQKSNYTTSLNIGLNQAKGKYIARMDADDISELNRISSQVQWMEENPQVVLCGSWCIFINQEGKTIDEAKYPIEDWLIRYRFLWGPCFNHPTMMFRASILKKHKLLYDTTYNTAEDCEFAIRLAQYGKLANLPLFLVKKRVHNQQVSEIHYTRQREIIWQLRTAYFKSLGIKLNKEIDIFHQQIVQGEVPITYQNLQKINEWFSELYDGNQNAELIPQQRFFEFLQHYWCQYTHGQHQLGLDLWKVIRKSEFSDYHQFTAFQKLKFFVKSLIRYK